MAGVQTFLRIDDKFANENGLKELSDSGPMYCSYVLAYGIASAYSKLKSSEPKLSAVEFFGCVLMDDLGMLNPKQKTYAEKSAEDVIGTLTNINDVCAKNTSDDDITNSVDMDGLENLGSAILRLNDDKLDKLKQNENVVELLDDILKINSMKATTITTNGEWWKYYWLKTLRHKMTEQILTNMHSENRPFNSWIKNNDKDRYILLLDKNCMKDKETKIQIKNMEKILIESFDTVSNRLRKLKNVLSQ